MAKMIRLVMFVALASLSIAFDLRDFEEFIRDITPPDVPRDYTQAIQGTNGRNWGTWRKPDMCPDGSFAYGFRLKIQANQGTGDNTAMNGIEIKCSHPDGRSKFGGSVSSGIGDQGEWTQWYQCNKDDEYLAHFSLKVQENQGRKMDDTAANGIKFACRSSTGMPMEMLDPGNNNGPFGSYGNYVGCPNGSVMCGVQTNLEKHMCHADDTAINDVKLYCCAK